MGENGAHRRQLQVRQAAAYADQQREHELNLMAIQVSWYANIVDDEDSRGAVRTMELDGLVGDSAVADNPLQRVTERPGRCHDVIEQPGLAKIEVASEVEPKKIILQRVRYELEQDDLISHAEARVLVLNLLDRQAGGADKPLPINTHLLRAISNADGRPRVPAELENRIRKSASRAGPV
jgi:hypothetical protein